MASVKFSDDGYSIRGVDNSSGDRKHRVLLKYISEDLSCLPGLLERYVSKKMDITNFELTDYQYDNNDSLEIFEFLKKLHPYYEDNHKQVLINAIGDYLNTLIIHTFIKNPTRLRVMDDREWYFERFAALVAPIVAMSTSLEDTEFYLDNSYGKYKESVGLYVQDSIEETFIFPDPLIGFYAEIQTQKKIKRILSWTLDISVPYIGELAVSQRVWLYAKMFPTPANDSEMEVTISISLNPDLLLRDNRDGNLESEEPIETDNHGKLFYVLGNLDIGNDDILPEMLNNLKNAAGYAKKFSTTSIFEEYRIDSLYQLLYLEILLMIRTNRIIRKCKECGAYFTVTSRKIAYCDGNVNGEPCTVAGPRRSFQRKMADEPELEMHNRAYKNRHAQYRKKKMTDSEFAKWCSDAKEKLEQVRAKELDIADFEAWLKK